MKKRLETYRRAEQELSSAFKALSSEALSKNNQSFIELATQTFAKLQEGAKGDLELRQAAIDQLIAPVKESLAKVGTQIEEIERSRIGAYEGLKEQLRGMGEVQIKLQSEASNLVKALGSPRVRGRWGEIQLRRVVELSGMLHHCDFREQATVTGEEGILRPDLVVSLPSGKSIVVDAKAPLTGYLEALEATDDATKILKLKEHARHIRDHIAALGKKAYWEQFKPSPEFVVLFVPGENFYTAALEQDPLLIENGVESGVIIATPTTLISMLKAVAYGWRQEAMERNAQEIVVIGQELHKRLGDLFGHLAAVGGSLEKSVGSYNKLVGSLGSRVMVSLRKLEEHLAVGEGSVIEEVLPAGGVVRELPSAE